MKKSIWIGWDEREIEACHVTRFSLLRHLSEPIPVHNLMLEDLCQRGLYRRPTVHRVDGHLIDQLSIRDDYDGSISTEHANARFFVPLLAKEGWALFMDGDMLVRADLAGVFHGLDPSFAVYCVKHNYWPPERVKKGLHLQTKYQRKNWSSFMIFNCDHPSTRHLTFELLNSVPGKDLHRFCWLADNEIGELAPEWNYLVGPRVEPAVVHFTEGLPNLSGYEQCEYSDEWRAELARESAMKDAAE